MKSHSKIYLLYCFILLILSGVAFYIIHQKISNNKKISDETYAVWKTEEMRRNELNNLQVSLKKIEADRLELTSHFVDSSDVVPFLNSLEKSALDAHVEAKIASVDAGAQDSSLTVDLSASGTFDAVYRFILLMENSPYEMEIMSMRVAKSLPSSSVDQNWNVMMRLRLISFTNKI